MSDPSTRPPYQRRSLTLVGPTDTASLCRRLADGNDIAVNIVGADGTAAVVSEQNLTAVLQAEPTTLAVDVLPEVQFMAMVEAKGRAGLSLATGLRRSLCRQAAAELASEVNLVLRTLDEIGLLLEVYFLQRRRRRVGEIARELAAARQALLESAAAARDNVRCGDDIRHRIQPLLDEVCGHFASAGSTV